MNIISSKTTSSPSLKEYISAPTGEEHCLLVIVNVVSDNFWKVKYISLDLTLNGFHLPVFQDDGTSFSLVATCHIAWCAHTSRESLSIGLGPNCMCFCCCTVSSVPLIH